MFTKCRPNNHAGRVRRLALLLSLILAAAQSLPTASAASAARSWSRLSSPRLSTASASVNP